MAELVVTRQGSLHIFELSRPQSANSLSSEIVEDMHVALDDMEDGRCRALLFKGRGKHFCAGFDLSDLASVTEGELLRRFVRIELLLARIWSAPFLTIALGHGRVVGAGADLFAACSIRIAVEGATFSFPGAGFGLVLGTRRLAERVGQDMAHALVAEGVALDAGEAARCGLATVCMAPEDAMAEVERLVTGAERLDHLTSAEVRSQIRGSQVQLDSDLAALVRSASRPGLRDRIIAYRKRVMVARR